jgi:hypothetical protein
LNAVAVAAAMVVVAAAVMADLEVMEEVAAVMAGNMEEMVTTGPAAATHKRWKLGSARGKKSRSASATGNGSAIATEIAKKAKHRCVNSVELLQPASPGPCANPNQSRDRAVFFRSLGVPFAAQAPMAPVCSQSTC